MEVVPFLLAVVFWLVFAFVLTHKEDVMDYRDSHQPLVVLGKVIPDSTLHRRIDYGFSLLFSLFGAAYFTLSAFFPEAVAQLSEWLPGNPTPR